MKKLPPFPIISIRRPYFFFFFKVLLHFLNYWSISLLLLLLFIKLILILSFLCLVKALITFLYVGNPLNLLFTVPSSGCLYHCIRPLFGGPGPSKTRWSLSTAPHIEVNCLWKDTTKNKQKQTKDMFYNYIRWSLLRFYHLFYSHARHLIEWRHWRRSCISSDDRPITDVDVSPATSIPINDIDAVDGERLPTGGNVVRVTSYHMQAPFPYMHKRL